MEILQRRGIASPPMIFLHNLRLKTPALDPPDHVVVVVQDCFVKNVGPAGRIPPHHQFPAVQMDTQLVEPATCRRLQLAGRYYVLTLFFSGFC